MSFSPDASAVIPKMVAAMENILKTAAQEETVKRFVLTSSSAAALIAQANVKVEVTKGTPNPVLLRPLPFITDFDKIHGMTLQSKLHGMRTRLRELEVASFTARLKLG